MSGAIFSLAVNFLVAICFSAVFAAVATRSRSRNAAVWIAAGFAVASLSAICELLVAYTSTPKPWAIGAFTTVLSGMILLHIGISELYGKKTDWRLALLFYCASIVLCFAIYDLPRGTPLQAFLYQGPFAVVLIATGVTVLCNRTGATIDVFLGVLLLFTGTHFLAKAGLAVTVGAGSTASDYIHTNYAVISQSATAVLMVSVGLTLLATLVLGIMTDQRQESERDPLSGLLNRRGFERSMQAVLSRSPGGSHALIVCDLDHFKRINDTYGHPVGDQVIRSFGALLALSVPTIAPVGRIGGEEFAICLPNADIETALLLAQALRRGTSSLSNLPDNLHVTASFGVAALTTETGLSEAYRQADLALYKAKETGRDRVKIAVSENRASK